MAWTQNEPEPRTSDQEGRTGGNKIERTTGMKNASKGNCRPPLPAPAGASSGRALLGTLLLAAAPGLVSVAASSAGQGARSGDTAQAAPSLEETRLTMGKWIETQQIISKERKEWQQGKEILLGRLELIKQEVAALQEKIEQTDAGVAEVGKKRAELVGQKDQLESSGTRLTAVVGGMENELRRLFKAIPEPARARIQPLVQRVPEDPANARISLAERFQNVLGILNELNKANNEITVSYEVRQLADGRPAEVQALYVGLAQGYYVSASGEAGIGQPTAEGWQWAPSKTVAAEVLEALEILQGKQSPAFVPLPVKIQ